STLQDCKKPSCDADGNIIDVADPGDAPADDKNACTAEGCNGTTPIDHTPLADSTPCGAAQACVSDGAGAFQTVAQPLCAAGVCMGGNPTPCGLFACDSGNTDCRTSCAVDAHCIGTAYCAAATQSCKAKVDQGKPCASDNECKTG